METKTPHPLPLCLAFVLCLSLLLGCTPSLNASVQENYAVPKLATVNPPPQYDDPREQAIDEALQEAARTRQDIAALLMFQARIDHVAFSDDGKLALVWIAWIDPESLAILPGELSLAIARLEKPAKKGDPQWKLYFQADKEWARLLTSLPAKMLGAELRQRYLAEVQAEQKDGKVFRGYRLPWESGRAKYLTGSIGHVYTYKTCPADCLYAFDFADGTMFPVLAARGGKVKFAVWRYPTGFSETANYLVLEDTTTDPTTYQLYYHLAQDSIPPELRVVGAKVQQGQYIGQADNTGPSTGHHLHFMVFTGKNYDWGTSVDIVFDEVSVNGGRPRTCLEARGFPGYGGQCMPGNLYTSENSDREVPVGTIKKPVRDQSIKTKTLKVSAKATDDKGVDTIQLFYTFDGTWNPAGDAVKGASLSTTVDLCKLNIPDGDFFLALQVVDKAGKKSDQQTSMVHLLNTYPCTPAPTATPTLAPPTKTPVGPTATRTRPPTKTAPPTRTAKPAKPGAATRVPAVSKTKVMPTLDLPPRTPLPPGPDAPELVNPISWLDGEITDKDEIRLDWKGSQGIEYSSGLTGRGGFERSLEWQTNSTSWQVGKLPAGNYTWTVYARNAGGKTQTVMKFTVSFSDPPPVTKMEPPQVSRSSAVLLKWSVVSGLVDLDHFEIQVDDGTNPWTDFEQTYPASARQAWFVGKLGHSYAFRLHAVDKSGIAEPYPSESQATAKIESSCNADKYDKNGKDNQPQGYTMLTLLQPQEHNFCPENDQDWVAVSLVKGKKYRITANPQSGGASVNFKIFEGDGATTGGTNPAGAEALAHGRELPTVLNWTADKTAMYLLRFAPSHPDLAGTDVRYTIQVEEVADRNPLLYGLSLLLLPLTFFIYKAVQKIKAIKVERAAAYMAAGQTIPRHHGEQLDEDKPGKKRAHKNLRETLGAVSAWFKPKIKRSPLPLAPRPQALVMARKPKR